MLRIQSLNIITDNCIEKTKNKEKEARNSPFYKKIVCFRMEYDVGKDIGYKKECNEFSVTKCRTEYDTSSETKCKTVYR